MASHLQCIAAKDAVEVPYKLIDGPKTDEKLVQDGEVPHSPAATIPGRIAEAQAQATMNNSAYIQPRRLSGKANYVTLLKWLAKHIDASCYTSGTHCGNHHRHCAAPQLCTLETCGAYLAEQIAILG